MPSLTPSRRVDYILTHAAPTGAFETVEQSDGFMGRVEPDEYTAWLQKHVAERLEFERWFFGHYHVNNSDSERCRPIMDDIVFVR